MKKMYIFTIALLAANLSFGQAGDSLTFESYFLAPESFYDGADEAGDIQIRSFSLTNTYDVSWGSWNGFSISSITDNITPGWANQYASFAGGGSHSNNYGVYYPEGSITFNQSFFIKQLDVTNTAYAGISMRDGDAYGKKFGSETNANGDFDGTNGEDFFILHIIPKDDSDNLVGDTIDFYLADFRYADSTDDYILDTWTTIDLSNELIVARKLEFAFSSSDMGSFGINTPTYFALDNLVVEYLVGTKENVIAFDILPNPFNDQLKIKSESGGLLTITNQLGQVVFQELISEHQTIDTYAIPSGIYFASLTGDYGSTTSKIVKH